MAAKRNREVQLNFRVSPHELELIEAKMAQVGISNREAYLRKMAIDGYTVRLELPEPQMPCRRALPSILDSRNTCISSMLRLLS